MNSELERPYDPLAPDLPDAVVAVYVPRRPENFVPAIRALLDRTSYPVVLGATSEGQLGPLAEFGLEYVETWSAATLVNDVWAEWHANILTITDPVLVPPGVLDLALEALRREVRIATISFLSNDAGFLSFPHRNHPIGRPVDGHDEISVTRLLRAAKPLPEPVPIPMATGHAVLLSSVALSAFGPLENAPSGCYPAAVADFSFRARERGFLDILDAGTYCYRPSDISVERRVPVVSTGLSLDDNGWLHERHSVAHAFVEEQTTSETCPLALALQTARAKAVGLRVLIDGSCLGPLEMGTQVSTVALIESLAARADVQQVGVALPGAVPGYAAKVLNLPKVRALPVVDGDLTPFGRMDIAHRPFQPNDDFDVGRWRSVADRVVVSVLDLISYHIGTYSGDAEAWLRYRDTMRRVAREVDGVTVISVDVARLAELERLPIGPDRLYPIPYGTEHLSGNELARVPAELLARGFLSEQFILCLGTNYSHKNRDLAIRAFLELRRRGWPLALVLVGAAVPWGSSRAREDSQGLGEIFVLPELPSEERNWLFRHASLLFYPTSAEGFGLVPYEAARFGTPSVYVSFGPLGEIAGEQPVLARDWSPEALADAAEALLRDPALSLQQVEACLAAGAPYTWARTTEELVTMYRELMARPPRCP